MEQSPTNNAYPNDTKLEFTETVQNEDFKRNVCIPYFKDIYKVPIFEANNIYVCRI